MKRGGSASTCSGSPLAALRAGAFVRGAAVELVNRLILAAFTYSGERI